MSANESSQPMHGPVYDFSGLGFRRGEVVIVTGGGSGIGRATALTAARSGLNVAIWDLNQESADETLRQIHAQSGGTEALALTADVADDGAVSRALEQSAKLGACRYLVNNAGPASAAPGSFYDNLEIAVGSVYRVTTAWLDGHADEAASVVNVSSIAGNFIGSEREAFYPAAKSGIAGYTRYLAVVHRGKPRANAVAPGFTITPRTAPYLENATTRERVGRIPVGRMGHPEDIAAAICFLLSPAAAYVNGVVLPVDGGSILK